MKNNKIFDDLVCINTQKMDNNTFLLFKDKKVVIIDPSFAADDIINNLDDTYKVVGVVLTHAHFDHYYETNKIIKVWDCPVYIHKEDEITYEKYNYADPSVVESLKFDKNIKYFSGKELVVDEFKFEVILTPGHTKGSVCLKYNNYVFVGDVIFYDSCGRTDLSGSSPSEMTRSLKYLWKYLKDDDFLLCGHGKNAYFKEIKQNNSVVKQMIE